MSEQNGGMTGVEVAQRRLACGCDFTGCCGRLCDKHAAELIAGCEAEAERRREQMPDTGAALRVLFDAYTRLKEMGWSDAVYCPKDGTEFVVIEAGSTGVHPCIYEGEWPNGRWWITAGGDMSPSRPILYRYPSDTDTDHAFGRRIAAARARRAALSATPTEARAHE